jgi:hypothetical protein
MINQDRLGARDRTFAILFGPSYPTPNMLTTHIYMVVGALRKRLAAVPLPCNGLFPRRSQFQDILREMHNPATPAPAKNTAPPAVAVARELNRVGSCSSCSIFAAPKVFLQCRTDLDIPQQHVLIVTHDEGTAERGEISILRDLLQSRGQDCSNASGRSIVYSLGKRAVESSHSLVMTKMYSLCTLSTAFATSSTCIWCVRPFSASCSLPEKCSESLKNCSFFVCVTPQCEV